MRKLVVVALVILGLASCSNQLGYKFADTLIEWQIDNYVDLTSAQEVRIDQTIDELHLWHARSELPLYRDLLSNLRDKIAAKDVTEQDIEQLFSDAAWLWDRLRIQIEPYAQMYLPELTSEQQQELFAALDERMEERREELAEEPFDEALKDTRKRLERNMKSWLGNVEPSQRSYMSRWLEQRDDMREDWLAYNTEWQAQFQQLYSLDSADLFSAQLRQLILQPEQLRGAEFQRQLQQNRTATIIMMAELHDSMTVKQRRHLLRKIDGYLDDLDELIAYYEPDNA